jgi:hypothetical protein
MREKISVASGDIAVDLTDSEYEYITHICELTWRDSDAFFRHLIRTFKEEGVPTYDEWLKTKQGAGKPESTAFALVSEPSTTSPTRAIADTQGSNAKRNGRSSKPPVPQDAGSEIVSAIQPSLASVPAAIQPPIVEQSTGKSVVATTVEPLTPNETPGRQLEIIPAQTTSRALRDPNSRRGRPPKGQEEPTTSNVPKRPGRPRKNAVEPVSVKEPADQSNVKRRGRPPGGSTTGRKLAEEVKEQSNPTKKGETTSTTSKRRGRKPKESQT